MNALEMRTQYIHDAIVAQAHANPSRPAVIHEGVTLTYSQLVERASLLKGQLRAAGVQREVTVASCLPRGIALAPTILGIWMAGGAYVPVDPDGPAERRDYILRDSHASVAVVVAGSSMPMPDSVSTLISVDAHGVACECCQQAAVSTDLGSRPTDLAYVIYTSGTTGRPKGVMVDHGNVIAMARSHEETLFSGQGKHVQQVALNNVTTADSFFSDFVHLAYGRTLHVVDDATRRDPERLAQFLTDHAIDMLDGTPTQIRSVLLAGGTDALASLTILVVGGEPTGPDLWQQLRDLPGVSPHNLYGPTECTVAVTAASLHAHHEPVIGTPLPGCEVWVVDDELRPVPDGQIGELFVTGAQVARGYLNAGTAGDTRFVTTRLPGRTEAVRGYRTGDRGLRNQAGQLVFLGRTDDQVSIGGYRVELGEVQTRLRACAGVRDAAVAAQGEVGEITLVAWVNVEPTGCIDSVRTELAATLPRHMIPVTFPVAAIPMGPTGKADIAALSQLVRTEERARNMQGNFCTSPQGDTVAAVRKIWLEALCIDRVGEDEDFFALGGDSLKATRTILAIRETLVPGVPIRLIFEHPRLQDFCAAISTLVSA
jgi:amino acid adenylation domain-containing protein